MSNAAAGFRVLVVEDEATIRFALREYFAAQGWSVACAASVVEGLQELDESPFHVAILDLRLGDERNGGILLAEQIARSYPTTRTILLTAYGSKEAWTTARAIGVDEVLDKPTPLWELNETARRLAAGTAGVSAPSSDRALTGEERGHNGHKPFGK